MSSEVTPCAAVELAADSLQKLTATLPSPLLPHEAEEEDEEEEEEEEDDDEEGKARTASLTSRKFVEENRKERIIDETETTQPPTEDKPNNADSNQMKAPDKKGEENSTDNRKQIEQVSTTTKELTNGQVELQPKIPIIKVEKEPTRGDDDDENSASSTADNGVNSKPSEDVETETKPKIGSLTVLGPSLLNSSVMKNGAVSITPANALASPLNALSAITETINGGFVDGEDTCDVCGVTTDDLETHRMSLRHYKCNESPLCAALVFDTRHQLNGHRANAHNLSPQLTPAPAHHTAPEAAGGERGVITPVQCPLTIQPRPFASLAAGPPITDPDSSNGSSSRTVMVKRLQPETPPGAPNAKGRRLDVLLPDSHDDVDCHVLAIQRRNNTSGLQIQTVQGGGTVQLRPGSSVSITASPAKPKEDANSVANILATRGITVTPAGSNRQQQQQQQPPPPPLPAPLTLSSAISILPATNQTRQERGFAVPQGRVRPANSSSSLPTVDLTREDTAPLRPRRPSRFTCQVCDKAFATREALSSHMASHSSPGKLPYRCNLCNAQYPTQQGLTQHKQTFHHKQQQQQEMVLPVVDLKQRGVGERLAALGVRHFVPLSQLQSQSGGLFGLPVIASPNSSHANLGALAATNILPLGPLKPVTHR